jgi:hypothetical protein
MAKALLSSPQSGLTSYPAGRQAIREGAVKWYSTTPLGVAAAADDDKARHYVQALAWASQQLADAAARALASGEQVGREGRASVA